jgi:hypothetical protein
MSQTERFARHIVFRGKDMNDYACKQCVPTSAWVVDGFVCVYHEALAVVERADAEGGQRG